MCVRGMVSVVAVCLLASSSAAQPPPRPLTLSAAIRLALEQRPEVEAARAGVAAAGGAVQQADVGPNPVLSLQTENWRGGDDPAFSVSRDLDVYLFVTQRLETAGKRRHRTARARSDARIASVELERVEWQIRQEVKRAYWETLASQERERLLHQALESIRELARYHEIRWREGASSEADWLKVRLEEDKAQVAHALAALNAEQRRSDLLRRLGTPTSARRITLQPQAPDVGALAPGSPLPVERWLDVANQSRAELRLQHGVVDSAAAGVRVEEAVARPDLSPYLGYKKDGPFHAMIGGLSVPLPIRDRNTGRIVRMHALERQARARLRALQTQVRHEVAAAAETLRRRRDLLAAFGSGMTERADETYAIAEAAYREGGVDLLYLLDARRSFNDVALLWSQVLHDYQLSWIDLETAVGRELAPDRSARPAPTGRTP